jgi:hypothetical protein
MKVLLAFVSLIINLSVAYSQDEAFLNFIKKTTSVYSGSASIDIYTSRAVQFETTLDNQKVFLLFSSTNLDSTVFTVLNSNPPAAPTTNKNLTVSSPPEVKLGPLTIALNDLTEPTSTCDSSDVLENDKFCAGRKCNIHHRLVSKCNETNCWESLSTYDRGLWEWRKLGNIKLTSKIDISDCLPGSVAGQKYNLRFITDTDGGTIQYTIILQNDSNSSKKVKL